jgi:hypothetical protein
MASRLRTMGALATEDRKRAATLDWMSRNDPRQTIRAALIDLQPEGSGPAPLITAAAPTLGLGAGALGTSALAQYGPAPTCLW